MQSDSYALLDFGRGKRLEQWGPYRLIRPDPTATGPEYSPDLWQTADAMYEGDKGKGKWSASSLPEEWPVRFDDITLSVRLAPYKHTGAFPEQRRNWEWMRVQPRAAGRLLSVLHLFAYTGGATVALAKDGHTVTHVDASRPAIGWAKGNAALNGLPADRVRWILDDAPAFVSRERKRGKAYDAIILDPPAFGHAPTGKAWRVERDLKPLLEDCVAILSPEPAFLVLNGYARNDTPESFHRLLTGVIRTLRPELRFEITADDLALRSEDGRTLSTGVVARCAFRSVKPS